MLSRDSCAKVSGAITQEEGPLWSGEPQIWIRFHLNIHWLEQFGKRRQGLLIPWGHISSLKRWTDSWKDLRINLMSWGHFYKSTSSNTHFPCASLEYCYFQRFSKDFSVSFPSHIFYTLRGTGILCERSRALRSNEVEEYRGCNEQNVYWAQPEANSTPRSERIKRHQPNGDV